MTVTLDITIHQEIWNEHARLMVHGMELCLIVLVRYIFLYWYDSLSKPIGEKHCGPQ